MIPEETRARLALLKAAAGPDLPRERRPPCGEEEADKVPIPKAPPLTLSRCIGLLELARRQRAVGAEDVADDLTDQALRGLHLLDAHPALLRAEGARRRREEGSPSKVTCGQGSRP